jgi:hypothetical protein
VTTLEERLMSSTFDKRWRCLAIDRAAVPAPPYDTWIGLATDDNVAAIAWATPIPILGRILVRAHVIAHAGVNAAAPERCDPRRPWDQVIRGHVDAIARNTRLRAVRATIDLEPLIDWLRSETIDADVPRADTIAKFDSFGIVRGELAHDGDDLVNEQARHTSVVGDCLMKHHRESICAIGASAIAFRAAW